MELVLNKKPKNPIIIEGFPGLGFVSTIAVQFLIEHLDTKQIGRIESKEESPMVAIHNNSVVDPFGIFYDEKHNIILLNAISGIVGLEWKLADMIEKLAKILDAKEVISIEGVGSQDEEPNAFFYSSDVKAINKFRKMNLSPLKDGIIIGATGALLLKEKLPLNFIFVSTHLNLPDSRAAAKIIEVLDEYLNLKIDYKPLLKKAEMFEAKLKTLMSNTKQASMHQKQKDLNYLG